MFWLQILGPTPRLFGAKRAVGTRSYSELPILAIGSRINPMGGMPIYDFGALLFVAPALILAFIAQMWVSSAYARGKQAAAKMSGFLAARQILDASGLQAVEIESIPGELSDHY